MHSLTELEQQQLNNAQPCPFCGSTKLTTSLWSEDNGEYIAISCKQCNAEAPGKTWNDRAGEEPYSLIEQFHDDSLELPEFLKRQSN